MSAYYLDTSALVKLYVREAGTQRMLRLASGAPTDTFTVLAVSRIETYAAVRRRESIGDLTSHDVQAALAQFEQDWGKVYLVQPVTDRVLEEARSVLTAHVLRAYDAMQIAGCVALRATSGEEPTFVCSDRQLLSVAATLSLQTLDPTD